MLLGLADSRYRLYRPGDECHPGRKGKTTPRRSEIPGIYHGLLDWYEREYCAGSSDGPPSPDACLRLFLEQGGRLPERSAHHRTE